MKCPKCGKEMTIVQGKYPFIAFYYVCLPCEFSILIKDDPSYRSFGTFIDKFMRESK